MRGRNNLSEFECIINRGGGEGTAKMLVQSCRPVCACMCLCVGEEFLSGAAVALWPGTSLLQERVQWKVMRSGPFSLLEVHG